MKPTIFFLVLFFLLSALSGKSQWTAVGTGVKLEEKASSNSDAAATIRALAVYKGELYAGGIFKIAGDKPASNIARWNGKEWNPVGSGTDGKVLSFCIYKDELYVGGAFSQAGGVASTNIARWNGQSWLPVGEGTDSDVQALAVYNNELYAGGDFTEAGGIAVKNIARWNGAAWLAAGHGTSNELFSLAEVGGELHAGGEMEVKDGEVVHNLFKWNGKRWAAEGDFDGEVRALTVYNGKFIAGGAYGKVNDEPFSFVTVQNDKIWQSIGAGIGSHTPTHHVSALLSANNILYIGGNFKSYFNDDHREANNVAQWDGTNWANLGKGVNGDVYSLVLYNGEVYAAGSFTSAGETAAFGIAKWKP